LTLARTPVSQRHPLSKVGKASVKERKSRLGSV
jgi:hypothetical protein